MAGFVVTVLLCTAATPPDSCDAVTALDAVSRPASAIECLIGLAPSGLADLRSLAASIAGREASNGRPDQDFYLKTRCERKR